MFIGYNQREGIDNRVEFIMLWNLLQIKIKVDIKNLQMMGDLKVVIDLERKNNATQDIILASIMRDIKVSF
jgi:hypothetical protein